MSRSIFFSILLLALPLYLWGERQEDSIVKVFENGQEGYACFRIPAIIRCNSGKLIAFAEGRKRGSGDTGDIDIVMKQSNDGGKSWSRLSVVWDDGENVCGNPAPVVDAKSGKIVLVACHNLGRDSEGSIMQGKSAEGRRVYVLTSTDEGASWSPPREITSCVKLSSWGWYATGPCHGIELQKSHKGRIVIPANHSMLQDRSYHSHLIYSDDLGESWHLGGVVQEAGGNESSVVELKSGRLMQNMRNYNPQHPHMRAYATSDNGGESLSGTGFLPQLIEPVCQGSTLRCSRGKYILFSNPASGERRERMTLKLSRDNGLTWPGSYLVYAGPAAYSDMVNLPKGKIGLLFEFGKSDSNEAIGFVAVKMKEIKP